MSCSYAIATGIAWQFSHPCEFADMVRELRAYDGLEGMHFEG